jgi:hypothetical protein
MFDMSLLLKDPEQSADSRIARRIGQRGLHLRCSDAALGMKNVHDLAFAAAEMRFGIGTHVLRN